jgi:hypothetical protein
MSELQASPFAVEGPGLEVEGWHRLMGLPRKVLPFTGCGCGKEQNTGGCTPDNYKDADLNQTTKNTLRLFRLRTARAIVADDATRLSYGFRERSSCNPETCGLQNSISIQVLLAVARNEFPLWRKAQL